MKTAVSDVPSSGSTPPSAAARGDPRQPADRLEEAGQQGWVGEVAAIETTLAAAAQKLEAMRELTARSTTVSLGMPGHPALAAKTPGRSSRLTPAIERQGIPHEQRE